MHTVTPFSSAGVILSYTCSSACRHCLYGCNTYWRGWMEPGLLRAIYAGMRGRVRGLHLAGGEAFLNFPLLLQAVQWASEAGIPLDYVETNAHWYTDHAAAVEKLTALREAGLGCLLISASPFHAEFVPVEKTTGVIAAARQVFGSQGAFVWLPEFLKQLTAISETGTIPFERYARAVGARKAREAATYHGQLVPGGRAAFKLDDYLPLYPLEACLDTSCEYELLHSGHGHYDCYGHIIPCSCTGLSLGDAADLPALYDGFSLADRPLLALLVEHGVQGLYEMAVADFGYTPLPAYAGKCHLCVHLRKHLVEAGVATPELAPRALYREIG